MKRSGIISWAQRYIRSEMSFESTKQILTETYQRDLAMYERDLADWNIKNTGGSPTGKFSHYKHTKPPKKPTKVDIYQEMFVAQTTVAVGVLFLFLWRAIRALGPRS